MERTAAKYKNTKTRVFDMKREELEKYVGELSPEMQEKARECKTKEELNALLAENDVELSEDALKAVSGGCTTTRKCPQCGGKMEFFSVHGDYTGWRCTSCGYTC